jgi:hypothetical protein
MGFLVFFRRALGDAACIYTPNAPRWIEQLVTLLAHCGCHPAANICVPCVQGSHETRQYAERTWSGGGGLSAD